MIHIRLLGSFLVLLATALLLSSLRSGASQPAQLARFALPQQVETWTAVLDEEFDEDVLSVIEPDAYAMRLYEAEGRTPVWVYVGMYGGRAGYGKGAHDPEVCFPAQGWEILRTSSAVVPQEEDRIHTKLLRVQRVHREQAVLYWFQPASRWPRAGALEQFLRVLDAASGRPQYAFVRLSGPRDGSRQSESDLIEFASALAPAIRGEVESF